MQPSAAFLKRIHGASEKDIVNSGLAYSMERGAEGIKETVAKYGLGLDLRTAAYARSIESIYLTYKAGGYSFS